MPPMKFSESEGSAIVEFIVFVLFGQLLVFAGSLQIAENIDQKVRLDLFASQLARAEAVGKAELLIEELRNDYRLPDAAVLPEDCPRRLVCLRVTSNGAEAIGMSVKYV